jgi:hypothetical protein
MSSPDAPKSFMERARDAAANVAANAKAAAQIAAKQAERGKISQITLPGAYWALGKEIRSAGHFQDEFGDLYAKIDEILGKIQSLKQAHPEWGHPQKLTDRAKAAAGHAADLAKAKALKVKANGVLRELGKRTYEKHGEQAGTATVIQPVLQALARLETLDREIKELSESHSGSFLTPTRMLVVGAAVVVILAWSICQRGSHPAAIVGKWESTSGSEGIEFLSDGTAVSAGQPPIQVKWNLLDDGRLKIEGTGAAQGRAMVFEIKFEGDRLVVRHSDETQTRTYKRVSTFSKGVFTSQEDRDSGLFRF